MVTDMTVCDGGNHITFYVDGSAWRTLDTEQINPSLTHYEIAQFMAEQPEQDVELLYNIIITIRTAQAYTFEDIRTAVLSTLGGGA